MPWYFVLFIVCVAVGVPALICELTDRALDKDA